jgi:hypothetical protein
VSAEPAPESDVDLVIISESPDELLFDRTWIDGLGEAGDPAPEDWGKVQSLRARFADELEVEFGITGHEWLKQPIDGGTAKILRKGVVIVFDRAGYLEMALAEFKTLRFEGTIISDA